MSMSSWFGWKTEEASDSLPNIFPLKFKQDDFVTTDVVNIFSKILTDVLERIHGLSDDVENLMWDNCIMSESNDGLVTMLSKAMANKNELFLIYEKALKLVRPAKQDEISQIRQDYKLRGESSLGIYISFKNYTRSDMVKLYSALEYCTISALNKNMNLSNAIQVKISDLRGSVSLADSAGAKTQAQTIASGLANGLDVLLDAKDSIETSKPDLTSVKEAILFLNQKHLFYLGMPASYINGEQTAGLGDSGQKDTKAVERGLKNYYFSIIKPVLEALFKANISYKSQDYAQITQALEAMKTFELTGEELVSLDNKKRIIEQLLDIDKDDNKTAKDVKEEPKALPPAQVKIPVKAEA